MLRLMMLICGLCDMVLFYWDGILGDFYGGNNSVNVYILVELNSDFND